MNRAWWLVCFLIGLAGSALFSLSQTAANKEVRPFSVGGEQYVDLWRLTLSRAERLQKALRIDFVFTTEKGNVAPKAQAFSLRDAEGRWWGPELWIQRENRLKLFFAPRFNRPDTLALQFAGRDDEQIWRFSLSPADSRARHP